MASGLGSDGERERDGGEQITDSWKRRQEKRDLT
jgi:hypothetical protein